MRNRQPYSEYDEHWLLLDTDHWFTGSHRENTMRTISEARKEGFIVALSNPCFELWLLLHHEQIQPDVPFDSCANVEQRLRTVLGGYNKTQLKRGQFTVDNAIIAISRGMQLTPNTIDFPLPNPGTGVWKLVDTALADAIRRHRQ